MVKGKVRSTRTRDEFRTRKTGVPGTRTWTDLQEMKVNGEVGTDKKVSEYKEEGG